jgi:nucleoside-diphosphate-sugar epimerase
MKIHKTLLTGASGFLGKYIYDELNHSCEVVTISRNSASINVDLAKDIPILPEVDLVIHCAGKAHVVPKNNKEKEIFFDVNFTGTANLLKGIELAPKLPKYFILISTIAVYGCEFGTMINEQSPLNAKDAYGISKIQAEKLVQSWCTIHNVKCSILRLPLVVGKNPPGNLAAMIKGILKGYYFNIGGGKAKKSMVLASDVAKIIPSLAVIGGVYNLTDGYHPSFSEISEVIAKKMNKPKPYNIPLWLAKVTATFGDLLFGKLPIDSNKLRKIVTDLTFDDSKARASLKWSPSQVLKEVKL